MSKATNPTAEAIWNTLSSPNVLDSNGENANLVDVIHQHGQDVRYAAKTIADAILVLAKSIENANKMV